MTERLGLPGFGMCCGSFGTGRKKLVLIPGLSVKNTTDRIGAVERAYRELAEDYTVYLIDRRENPPDGYRLRDMAEDTAAAMDMLKIGKTSICGTSQGGMIAQYIAMRYPERTEKLILTSTCFESSKLLRETMSEWVGIARTGDSKKLNRAFIDRLYRESLSEEYRDRLLAVSPDYTAEELRRFAILAETMLDMDIEKESGKRLREIDCPTLVIGCEGDRVVGPEASAELARRIGGELHMYGSEYGHAVYDEAPDYVDRLKEFLKK